MTAASEGLKQVLARPIQLSDHVSKLAGEVRESRIECVDLKMKAEKLSSLLRQAARADLYERPTRRIMDGTSLVLEKALVLVSKYRSQQSNFVRRVLTIVPAAAFKKMSSLLENSISDVSWLLRVSTDDDGWNGLAPIATNEPYLCLIWEQIAKLQKGGDEAKTDAAATLVSYAQVNERYGKLIVEEGGIQPLLKVLKECVNVKAQESAATVLGVLGKDEESVKAMVEIGAGGACSVFSKILKEGDMRVQAVVASAVGEFAERYPVCKDLFAQNHAVRLLVGHLAFETVQEHSKYTAHLKPPNSSSPSLSTIVDIGGLPNVPKQQGQGRMMMHNVVQSTIDNHQQKYNHQYQHIQIGMGMGSSGIKGRENEDPIVKARLKVMAATALWKLAKGNPGICKTITESRALLCFAVLLEKGPEEVKHKSAMAVMEIARVAEENADLRRSAFNPSSPAAKAVVDQVIRIVAKADYSDILVPCIITLGCLSKSFRATECRIIGPLVLLLDERELDGIDDDVSKEAVIALSKFACPQTNYLHKDHSKAIIAEGGVRHLVQLVYLGDKGIQIPALILLCYIAFNVPDDEVLAQAEVLSVLEWATKHNFLVQDSTVDAILPETKSKLELYQSRGIKNF